LLEIDLKQLQRKKAKLDIAILLPTLFGANYYQFINKAGSQIEYFFPEFQEIKVENNAGEDEDKRDQE